MLRGHDGIVAGQFEALQPMGHFLESADISKGGIFDFDSA
jgi:hypothetical protein